MYSARIVPKMQPPSGSCVLKHEVYGLRHYDPLQPPSGGCVLKRKPPGWVLLSRDAAAFGRLCVETADWVI